MEKKGFHPFFLKSDTLSKMPGYFIESLCFTSTTVDLKKENSLTGKKEDYLH